MWYNPKIMSDLALRVDGLGKLYRLGAHDPYQDLRLSAWDALRRAKRRLWRQPPPPPRTPEGPGLLWALREISFEARYGEAIGIIGRNGAGKSTLLKILARITKPTRGFAEIYGRLGALLEVGTGFHPELTGRENIYLNAAILGLKKAEITRRFDEIVEFAELEQFIDTPVKHYSSGMFARLAFSVAAHLDPEILIVDEVLSVGDAAFQRKSLGKMEGVMRQGRTVLFVSHSLPSVVAFCSRCLWLDQGRLVRDGPSAEVTKEYLDASAVVASSPAAEPAQVTTLYRPAGDNGAQVGQPMQDDADSGDGIDRRPGAAPLLGATLPTEVIYQPRAEAEQTSEETRESMRRGERYGNGKARFVTLRITPLGPDGRPRPAFLTGYDLKVEVTLTAFARIREANVALVVYDLSGFRIIDVSTALMDQYVSLKPGQTAEVCFVLHHVLLRPDTYRLLLWVGRKDIEDIDGLPFASSLTVEVNPNLTRHFQIFPGVYQCEFTQTVRLLDGAPAPAPASGARAS